MKDIKYYKEKIKEKRKNSDFRSFLKEIASWSTMNYYKNSGLISRYPLTNRSPKLISHKEFNNNRDELIKKGLDYNKNKSFFENFEELLKNIPLSPTISQMAGENTEFSDTVVASNNCYLSNIIVENCKNIFYSFQVLENCEDIFSSVRITNNSSLIYFSNLVSESFKIFYSKNIKGSNNIWFSSSLYGCSECILCSDLENKSYCIKNKEYNKEEYFIKKEEILQNKDIFIKFYKNIKDDGENILSNNIYFNTSG